MCSSGSVLYVVCVVAYVEVVRIPQGAVHIRVTETQLSKNYLGNSIRLSASEQLQLVHEIVSPDFRTVITSIKYVVTDFQISVTIAKCLVNLKTLVPDNPITITS